MDSDDSMSYSYDNGVVRAMPTATAEERQAVERERRKRQQKRNRCFPAGAQLRMVDGSVVRIEHLQLGDAVQIITASATSAYAAVHTISHANAAVEKVYCYATAAGRNITAECNNFIPAINASCVGSCNTYAETSLKIMGDLEVGDTIFEANSGTATASAVVVTAVGTDVLQGLYHLHANVETAALVVDGFVVSELANLDVVFGATSVEDGSSALTAASSLAQEGLTTSIEARGDVTPPPTAGNASTYLTPRVQMGLLRLSHLMYSSLGATLKAQFDAKFLVSNWFFESATEADVRTVFLLGEAFAKTADDQSSLHLTEQPRLAAEGFTSAVGATSIFEVVTFLFDAGDFFSNPQATNFSLTQVLDRTGFLAVLGGDNVTIESIDNIIGEEPPSDTTVIRTVIFICASVLALLLVCALYFRFCKPHKRGKRQATIGVISSSIETNN